MQKQEGKGETFVSSPQIKQTEIKILRFFQTLTKQLKYRQIDFLHQKKRLDMQSIIHISHILLFSSLRQCLPQYTSKSFAQFLQINRYNIKTKDEDYIDDQCDQAKQIKLSCQKICELFSKEAKELTYYVETQISLYKRSKISTQCLMAILQKLLYNFFISKCIDFIDFSLQERVQKLCKVSYEIILSFYSDSKFLTYEFIRIERANNFLSSLSRQQTTQLDQIQKQKDEIIMSTIQRRKQYQYMIKHQRQQQQRPKKSSPEIYMFSSSSYIQSSGNISLNCEKGNEFENEADKSQSLNESQNNNTKTQVSQIQQLERDKKTENQEKSRIKVMKILRILPFKSRNR